VIARAEGWFEVVLDNLAEVDEIGPLSPAGCLAPPRPPFGSLRCLYPHPPTRDRALHIPPPLDRLPAVIRNSGLPVTDQPPLLASVLRLLVPLAMGPLLTVVMVVGLLSRPWACRLRRDWCRLLLGLLGIRLEIADRNRGRLDNRAAVYVLLNQSSVLEGCYLPLVLPLGCRTMANIEYLLLPWYGWCTWMLDAVMVIRQWPAQRSRALARTLALLARGQSFIISIEGARSREGLLPYKTGPVRMALATGVPLVPVIFHGSGERLPVGAWRVRPGTVRVVLGEPVETVDLTLSSTTSLVAELRSIAERELGLTRPVA
jgi:1-acyl-sn-glycerol-3-phosphate acyltransferase